VINKATAVAAAVLATTLSEQHGVSVLVGVLVLGTVLLCPGVIKNPGVDLLSIPGVILGISWCRVLQFRTGSWSLSDDETRSNLAM